MGFALKIRVAESLIALTTKRLLELILAFDLTLIDTRLSLIEWRDQELAAITEQLELAFPQLLSEIRSRVATLSTLQVARAEFDPRPLTLQILAPWVEAQTRIAVERAETEFTALIANLKADGQLGAIATALPALAGVGMLAASVLALPTVVTWATITTTSLFFFTTSSISVPLLLIGGTALAGLSLTGVKVLGATEGRLRNHLVARVEAQARSAVFGSGLDLDARCLLNDLQAAVLRAGQARLRELI